MPGADPPPDSKGRRPLQQVRQAWQGPGGAAVDPLPFLLCSRIEYEVITVGQNPLGSQAPLAKQKGAAVGAEGRSGMVEQSPVCLTGPQFDAAGLGWAGGDGCAAGHGPCCRQSQSVGTARSRRAVWWCCAIRPTTPDPERAHRSLEIRGRCAGGWRRSGARRQRSRHRPGTGHGWP